MDKFVIGFHSRLEMILSLSLDEKLEGHTLRRQAILDQHNRNVIIGSAGGNYSLQSISAALRNAVRTEELPATSMTASGPWSHRPSCKTSKSRPDRHTLSGLSSSSQAEFDEPSLFYSFMRDKNAHEQVSAVVDSGACASVVGKATLDAAL